MIRTRARRLNPAEPCGGIKPAADVTDRALRYRANSEECTPEGPRRCMWCGLREKRATANLSNRDYYGGKRPVVEVAHIDGDETNTTPENLAWTCRSCNQRVAAVMRKAGVGRPTNQYNPAKKRKGATDYREYARALGILDGSATGDVADAVALIHATSKVKRSEFQKDIWEVRKERYGPSGRKDGGSVPF